MPKKTVKKERLQVYVPPMIADKIKILAEKRQTCVSDIVIAGIYMYLKEHGDDSKK